jgi:hypothetical protein
MLHFASEGVPVSTKRFNTGARSSVASDGLGRRTVKSDPTDNYQKHQSQRRDKCSLETGSVDELFTLAQSVGRLISNILRGGLRLIESGKPLPLLCNHLSLAIQLQLLTITKLLEKGNDPLDVSFTHGALTNQVN